MNSALSLFDPRLIFLTAISFTNFGFGLFVWRRNRGGSINRAFLAFAFSLFFWGVSIASFFLVRDLSSARLAMQLCYLAAILIAVSFLHFANIYPFRHFRYSAISLLGLATATVLAIIVVFSPSYLVQAVFVSNGVRDVSLNQLGHTVFAFYFATVAAAIGYLFVKKYRSTDGVMKIQLKAVGIGCATTLTLGMIFNLLFPALGNHRYIWLGPYFTSAVTLFVAYTIKFSENIK